MLNAHLIFNFFNTKRIETKKNFSKILPQIIAKISECNTLNLKLLRHVKVI